MSRQRKRRTSADPDKDQPIIQRQTDGGEEDEDSSETYGTPIRSRKRFASEETRILEDLFRKTNRPTSDIKQKLAVRFNTTAQRIQIWFQNRRAKEKKLFTEDGAGTAAAEVDEDTEDATSKQDDKSSRKRGESSRKKRRREEEREDGPVRLHSNISLYQNPPPPPPFADIPNYPFPLARPYHQNMVQRDGRWYLLVPPPTVNPADMENPAMPGEQFTLAAPEQFYENAYDADSLELLAETSQQQQNTVVDGENPDILTHEDEETNLLAQGEFYPINQH